MDWQHTIRLVREEAAKFQGYKVKATLRAGVLEVELTRWSGTSAVVELSAQDVHCYRNDPPEWREYIADRLEWAKARIQAIESNREPPAGFVELLKRRRCAMAEIYTRGLKEGQAVYYAPGLEKYAVLHEPPPERRHGVVLPAGPEIRWPEWKVNAGGINATKDEQGEWVDFPADISDEQAAKLIDAAMEKMCESPKSFFEGAQKPAQTMTATEVHILAKEAASRWRRTIDGAFVNPLMSFRELPIEWMEMMG